MAEGGIFLDVFARLNLASVERVLRDVKTAMREGGTSAGRDFSEGFSASFKEITQVADLAFRDMQNGLANLQIQEAKINDLRARNFRASTDAMIAAQRDLDAAIMNSQRLMEASTAAAAERRGAIAAVPPRGGGEESRTGSRTARVIGAGSALALAGGAYESTRVAADTSRNMQQVMAFHQDAMHSQDYIQRQTQSIYQMATKVPFSPQELSKVYQDIENHGYTGQAALDVLNTSAQTAVATGANLKDTTDGLMTSVKDFGTQAELQSDNLDKYKQGLADLNQMAGQIVVTFGNMKGVNPDEFFRSLGTIEPTAMAAFLGPGSKLSGPQASAQVNSALSILAQIGIGPEQGSHNVSRIISQLGSVVPGSNMYNMLGQLGLNPEGIAQQTRDQGIFGPLGTIQQAIGAKTNPQTGMVDIGWRYNNAQVDANIAQDLEQLPPEARAFVAAHPEIAAGNARPFALKKEAPDAPWLQDVLTLSQWYTLKASPNKYTKKGGSTELTPEQVAQQLYGTGDIARTGLALGANTKEGQSMADQLTNVGAGALTKGFQDMMKTLPEQWKQLGSSLQALAGQLGEKAIPALTRFVGDLNEAADWLDKHKGAEQALVGVLGTIAAAWGTAKVINIFADLVKAFGPVMDGAKILGTLLSNRLPTQVATLGTASEETASEIKGSGIGGALRTGAANIAKAFSYVAIAELIRDEVHNAIPITDPKNQKKDWWHVGFGPLAELWDPTHPSDLGKARGGVVGYAWGGKVADPYSQSLMGMPDRGGDSVLGMMPGGMPIGLRGGEGILTPEAVSALGGKEGIDSLNKNPWANPMHVATTFYGSFARGVAKYSPWGKYLAASAGGLEALEKEFDESTKVHEGGGRRGHRGLPLEIEEMLDSGMSPQDVLQTLGATQGKRGGIRLGNGQYLSNEGKAMLGLPTGRGERTPSGGTVGIPGSGGIGPGAEKWRSLVQQITAQRGVSPAWVNPLLAQISTESSGDPHSINDHDPNGRGGIQTVEGLFNFLPSTFQGAGGGDIFNPVDQINNAITYGLQKPGSNRQQPQGFGYGQGWAHGGIVGYDGGGTIPPAVMDDQGNMISPGWQQWAVSHLGRDDRGIWSPSPNRMPDPGIAQFGYSVGGIAGLPTDGFDFGGAGTGGPRPGTDVHQGPAPTKPPATDSTNSRQLPSINPNAPGTQRPGPGSPKVSTGLIGQSAGKPQLAPQGDKSAPMAEGDRNIKANPSQQLTAEGKGFGVSGGILGAAESAASSMMPFGSGAGAQMAFQLMNRAIGYGGQLVGIGLEGLMSTFLPNNSELADPSRNIFGKMALGIAGAHPGGGNMAGKSAMQLNPKQDLDQGAMEGKQQVLPMVHISGDIHNHGAQDHEGMHKDISQALFGMSGPSSIGQS